MAEAVDDAIDGEGRDIGAGIFQECKTSRRAADFGNGRGERARQHRPAGDGGLRGRLRGGYQIDQIGFLQQRRKREDRHRDFRLIVGERVHHHQRRLLRRGEHVRQRAPHQRRRIVEQHDHRAFGGGDIVWRQIGMEVSARERGCGLGPFAGRSVTNPLQKLTDNHWDYLTRPTAIVHIDGTAKRSGIRLTKRSP